ncbi:type I-U CRISPR-associated protein Csx17 [Methylocaldum sp.]|uniref:type I-G CRISPR-associated protein Cas8g1/Csx17 n=1 Tax=Methylocaldum sp. TaxID=1969727 RepID=UPI0032209275
MSRLLTLPGCTPEPLGNYLKALGVFRLVVEQADPNAMGYWKDGYFALFSRFAFEDELIGWFKDRYQPSPLPAPWSVNSGWWPPDKQPPKRGDKRGTPNKNLRDLANSTNKRFEPIRTCLQEALQSMGGMVNLPDHEDGLSAELKEVLKKLESQPKKAKERARLVSILRDRLTSPSALRWLDAVGALSRRREDALYSFQLLADCGAEGVNSYIGNYYARLCEHLPVVTLAEQFWPSETGQLSELRLRAALLNKPGIKSRQDDAAGGLYSPALVEAPNIGQAFVASPKKRVNPWDFILTMEGLVLWASAATRRAEVLRKEQPAFPFYCDSAVGGATAVGPLEVSGQNEGKSRGEVWYPIWTRPASFQEIDRLFVEGRITQGQRTATRATQFALAVSSFGQERGIASFHRVGLLERSGSGDQTTTLAISLGEIPARRVIGIDLGTDLDPFVEQVSELIQHHANQPKRIVAARSRLDQAIFDFASSANQASEVDSRSALNLLTVASNLERELGVTLGKVKYKQGQGLQERNVRPIPPLSNRWLASNDGTAECRLARAIASIAPWGERDGRSVSAVEALRANLLPVTRQGNSWRWDDTSRSAVWARGATLFDNLAAVLRRRLIDASICKGEGLPLWSAYGASFSDLLALWNGELDEERLGDLIHALALIDTGTWSPESIDRSQKKYDPTPELHSSAVWFDSDDEPRADVEPVIWRDGFLLTEQELRDAFALPRVYALLKLCFVGGRLPALPAEGRTRGRTGEEPYPPLAPEILNLLRAGRLADTVAIAARKLRAKGYPSIFDPHDADAAEVEMSSEDCRRLAGMLLVPVRHAGVLAALAIKPRTSNL